MVNQTLNHCPSWLPYILTNFSEQCEVFICGSKWQKASYWMLVELLYFKSRCSIYGKFVKMTSFPRSTLLTWTFSWTSICNDLEHSSPKCGLNYHTTPFLSQLPNPNSSKNTNISEEREAVGEQLQLKKPLNILGLQTPPGSLSPGCSAPCPCFSLKDCLLYRLTHPFYSWESAWSRCCTDPIISMSDGLPGF